MILLVNGVGVILVQRGPSHIVYLATKRGEREGTTLRC
jgi:hypothetical protein